MPGCTEGLLPINQRAGALHIVLVKSAQSLPLDKINGSTGLAKSCFVTHVVHMSMVVDCYMCAHTHLQC